MKKFPYPPPEDDASAMPLPGVNSRAESEEVKDVLRLRRGGVARKRSARQPRLDASWHAAVTRTDTGISMDRMLYVPLHSPLSEYERTDRLDTDPVCDCPAR